MVSVLGAAAVAMLAAAGPEVATISGVDVKHVTVRNQRSRWGSCSAGGTVSLNWRLVQTPDSVRDYIIYHELMHLKRMDHSPAFWKLVAEVCPNYEEARRWLRRNCWPCSTTKVKRTNR